MFHLLYVLLFSTINKPLVLYPNNNNASGSFLLSLLLLCIGWCLGVSQQVRSNTEVGVQFSPDKDSSLIIRNNDHNKADTHKLSNILHQAKTTSSTTGTITRRTATTTSVFQSKTTHDYFDDSFSAHGTNLQNTEKKIKVTNKAEVKTINITCPRESFGLLLSGSSEVPEKQDKQITGSEDETSENKTDLKNNLQKDDVHIKIIDTDARFRRGPNGPFQRWRPPKRNQGRYWQPPRRGRNWNRKRWKKWRQRSNMTTPVPTSTALVETGNRRVIITQPDRKRQPNRNQTGGSTSTSRRNGHKYWNVPPFVLKMRKKMKQKIRQMSNILSNGLSDTLYNIIRRSKYIIHKYAVVKEDSRQLISDTHDTIDDIVKMSNTIYDTVLSISAFDRRLFERLYEQGLSPTLGAVPNVTDFVNRNYNQLNREAFIALRTLKHMRNKLFHLNHTYARHMTYYYDRLDDTRELISSQRFRIGDLMDMALYLNNQINNQTKLKIPKVLRQIRDETQELITDNYQNRHRLYIAEQIHQDVTIFQKSCQLRLEELSQVNYTHLKQLPRPTIEPLTLKEKRKLQILVNRVKGHRENILRSAAEIDNLLPTLINSGKVLILKLSVESQSDSHKVWALEKMMKRWYNLSGGAGATTHGNSKRKWMQMRRRRIRRMRKIMPKFKYPVSKRRRRAANMLQEDAEKIHDEIIQKLTDIIKKLDDMWLKLFELSPRKNGKCEQGVEGSGEDGTEVECELQGSGKMDITESESGSIPSLSLAGNNDNDDSNDDFEFTDVKTVVMSSHREHLQSIIHTSLSKSKSQLKISRNLGRDVQDIKVSLDEIRADKMKLESDVNKSAEVVSMYDGLVRNATEMRRLLNETEQKIKASQVKCQAAQKLAELVLADKDELERLLEVRKKEKEKEEKGEGGDGNVERKKKKRKRLKDKSNDNIMNVDKRRENKGKKDEKEKDVERVEAAISKKLLEENEETKAELKILIEKYLKLQEEDHERKNEEKRNEKQTENEEDRKERRKIKKRRNKNKNHSNEDDLEKKNEPRKSHLDSTKKRKNRKNKENVDKQMKKHTDEKNKKKRQRKNEEEKGRKDKLKSKKGEEFDVKKKKKKKITDDRKNEQNVNKLTEKTNKMETTKKKDSEIDSVLEIKKNLEDVLKKLNQRFEGSKKRSHRRRWKGRRRKRIGLESKKMNVKHDVNNLLLVGKKMVSDEKKNKELNEKEKYSNENEDRKRKRKKKKKAKNEVKDPKENMNEDEENNELKKKHKKDRNRKKTNEKVEGNLEEDTKNNSAKNKKRKKGTKKMEIKPAMGGFVLNSKEMVNDKKKELNVKEKDENENEEKRKKKRKKAKNETKEPKENVNEDKGDNEIKKKHKKNRNKKNTDKKVEGDFEEDTKNNSTKKKERKKDAMKIMVNDKNKEKNEEEKDRNEEKRKRKKAKNKVKDSKENGNGNEGNNDIKKKHKKDRNRKKTNEKVEENLEEDTNKRTKNKKRKNDVKKMEIKHATDGFVLNSKVTVNDEKNKELNEKEKDENENKKKRKKKRKQKDREVDLDKEKKERLKKKKSGTISAVLKMALEERKPMRNNSRSRKSRRKRKKILSEKIQNPPIFIQNEEQNLAEVMKNQSKQIEEDVYKSKNAVESLVNQLKGFSPDPCTSMSKNIKELRLNVSNIRQQIQLARTIVSSMKIPVSLNGEDHLEVMLDRNVPSREIQTSAEICIKPKTSDSIILCLQTNNSISYSLSLVDSKPLLTILDADGQVLQKLEADMELIQDNWYQLLVHRVGQNFSLSVNPTDSQSKGITVEKFLPDFSPEQLPLSLASVGGYPQNFPISNSEKLKGCIAHLNVNGHSTHIFSPYKNGLYPSICKTGCESLTNMSSMVFEGNGFALLELDKKTVNSVRLTFKTFQKTALLMAIKKKSEMFLLVTLIEGNIQVESQVKSSGIAKQSEGILFSDGQPHTIQITGINNELEIETSAENVEFEDKDASNDEMLFDEGISLGGVVSNLHNESKYRSFTGCLSNVSIDNTPLNLLYLKDGRHVYEGNCQENAWMSCARFTGSSVPVTLTKYDFVRSVSFMVSSQGQGVALFFERDSKFRIKLELTTTTLEVHDYENDESKTIPKKNGSGFWHLLHIEDQKGNIHITVDGEQSIDVAYTEDTSGWFAVSNAEDFSMLITIGGLPNSFKKVETFIGSISTLFIQHSFLNLNKEFTNSNKLSVCAKPTAELVTNNFDCAELIKK